MDTLLHELLLKLSLELQEICCKLEIDKTDSEDQSLIELAGDMLEESFVEGVN